MKELKDLKLKSLEDLRKMKSEDLGKELKDAQKKLFSFEMKLSLNEFKQTHLVKFLRRYVARVKTISNSSN
ncbi:MAG: 50S ribosomal protein L29 [Candidatus Gracilibacteria bacterium]|jgi:large subunit ribosomal protein L29|nr:50S ribosomal protein L29 [Candidatus Gracilibacteria bacterium]